MKMIRNILALALFAGAALAQTVTPITGYGQITVPAVGDWLVTVDISDTLTNPLGKTRKITARDFMGLLFPASSTDEACVRFDGTGSALQNIATGCAISDAGVITANGFTGPHTGNTTGNLIGNANTVTFADAGGDATTSVALGTAATGSLAPATDAGLTYDATTNTLTAGAFAGPLTGNVTGNVSGSSGSTTGNAATVTTNANLTGHVTSTGNAAVLGSFTVANLNTAINDGDVATGGGTATGTNTGDQTTISGNAGTATALAANPADCAANNYATTIAANGDLTCAQVNYSELTGTVPNAPTVTVADAAGDPTTFPLLGTAATGSLAPATDPGLSYNATTDTLTATAFAGPLTGNVTGNVTGTSGSTTGNAATVTASDAAGDTSTFPCLATAATGSLPCSTDAGLSYNATTDALTAVTFVGALTGTASGNPTLSAENTFTAAQTAQITDAGTTTVVYPLIVDHQSSGTPAADQGVGIAMDVETAAGNTERGATIEVVTTDVGPATEDFDTVFKSMKAGAAATEDARLTHTGAVGQLKFATAGTTAAANIYQSTVNAGISITGQSHGGVVGGAYSWHSNQNQFSLRNGGQFQWSSANAADGALDTGVERLAAAVVGATNGSTGEGWFQNEAGDKRLTANVTNATTTMSNLTDLSITLVAGRKYSCTAIIFIANSIAADGAKLDFDGGTATMTSFRAGGTVHDTTLLLATQKTAIADDFPVTTMTGDGIALINMGFVVNAGGTFIPRFAENATTTGTLTAYLNSSLTCKDTAN